MDNTDFVKMGYKYADGFDWEEKGEFLRNPASCVIVMQSEVFEKEIMPLFLQRVLEGISEVGWIVTQCYDKIEVYNYDLKIGEQFEFVYFPSKDATKRSDGFL